MPQLAALLSKIDRFVKIARRPLPKYTRTWGPYDRRGNKGDKIDRRQIIIVEHPMACDCSSCIDAPPAKGKSKRITMSYPKWLTEQRLGYRLDDNDTVDHVSYDVRDNSESNLVVRPRAEHSSLDTRRVNLVDCVCAEPSCGKSFKRSPRMLRDKAKAGRSGPFCNRACAARHARNVQYGKADKAPVQVGQDSTYYRRKIVEMAKAMAAKWNPDIIKLAITVPPVFILRDPNAHWPAEYVSGVQEVFWIVTLGTRDEAWAYSEEHAWELIWRFRAMGRELKMERVIERERRASAKDNEHLSPEDEELALAELDELRDTVPVETWRKHKHREVSGVQWRPEPIGGKEAATKAAPTVQEAIERLTDNQVKALIEVRDGVVFRGDRATKHFKYERDSLLYPHKFITMTNTWVLTDLGLMAIEAREAEYDADVAYPSALD